MAARPRPQQEARPFDWDTARRLARSRLGVEEFRPGQRELVDAVMRGRDALGIMPTGAGKSLCYQLPALFLSRPVVVVSPLISLMHDQQGKAVDARIGAATVNSTLSRSEERAVAEDIEGGEPDLVYVTPERLRDRGSARRAIRVTRRRPSWGEASPPGGRAGRPVRANSGPRPRASADDVEPAAR